MTLRTLLPGAIVAAALAAALTPQAMAQEAINTIAPTQPSVGSFVTKSRLRFTQYGSDPTDLDRSGSEVRIENELIMGLTPKLSLSASIPLIHQSVDDGATDLDATGFGDLTLTLKYRIWQHDPGPVDTRRLALYAGVVTPTGHEDLSPQAWNPFIGAVFMAINGRHGFNQSVKWTFTTGGMDDPIGAGHSHADMLSLDTAYLYRLEPVAYSSDFVASLYGVLELNTTWETNGDLEIKLSPGLLYEAPRFALEAGLQIPIVSDIEHRMETDISIVVGLRLLF
jgi:hypothetical protein